MNERHIFYPCYSLWGLYIRDIDSEWTWGTAYIIIRAGFVKAKLGILGSEWTWRTAFKINHCCITVNLVNNKDITYIHFLHVSTYLIWIYQQWCSDYSHAREIQTVKPKPIIHSEGQLHTHHLIANGDITASRTRTVWSAHPSLLVHPIYIHKTCKSCLVLFGFGAMHTDHSLCYTLYLIIPSLL